MDRGAVAIVGAGCRFPGAKGDLSSFDALSEFLGRGDDAVGPVPAERWRLSSFFDVDPATTGRFHSAGGAFLKWDYKQFDAALFGISPKEVSVMDPQQRLVLEVALECLYDAGADFDRLEGSRTGVFIGGFMLDHLTSTLDAGNWESMTSHSATSATLTMLSNRLSFALGLNGPSLTVDTACSSSLTTLHLACRALQARDADMCLVGGVNFMLRPETTMMLSRGRFLASDGRSKSFDASADGYGRGEGCGIVALRRQADAVADCDEIYGTILGTGCNQDGATPSITVPSGDAQYQLMESVYESAELTGADVDYFEAHGTGTPVGDPIEVGSIRRFLEKSGCTSRVILGSAKAGLGHQEAAAGVLGLLKAVASIRDGKVGRQGWFQSENPELHLGDSPLELAVDSAKEIGHPDRPIVASINSFGYGGTNAHAIVSGWPSSSLACSN